MPSGGHARSGPAPDPNALRRDRKDDAAWVTLPTEPIADVPEFPLSRIPVYDIYWEDKKRMKEFDEAATEALWATEVALWAELWRKPQAHMWSRLGLKHEVAAYVRAFVRSVSADGNASDRTAALRMAAEIGLSLPGMHQQRWKFAEDEVAAKRKSTTRRPAKSSARDRLAAIANGA